MHWDADITAVKFNVASAERKEETLATAGSLQLRVKRESNFYCYVVVLTFYLS